MKLRPVTYIRRFPEEVEEHEANRVTTTVRIPKNNKASGIWFAVRARIL